MMLSVENLDTGLFEVAMLLDEPPCRQYMPGAMGGQPWRRNSPLVAAMRSAQLYGHAWLYIVYRGDPVVTWGSKKVKVLSGGKLYMYCKTQLGNITGKFQELRYETVAAEVFHPVYGTPKIGGTYKVITNCSLELDPESDVDPGKPHPLLGYKDLRLNDSNGGAAGTEEDKLKARDTSKFIPRDLYCHVEWTDQNQYGETWMLQDADGLRDYRFELTEYSRRTFVNHVLKRLGFVASDLPVRQQQLAAHIGVVAQSLKAISSLVKSNEKAMIVKKNIKNSAPIPIAVAERPISKKKVKEITPKIIDVDAVDKKSIPIDLTAEAPGEMEDADAVIIDTGIINIDALVAPAVKAPLTGMEEKAAEAPITEGADMSVPENMEDESADIPKKAVTYADLGKAIAMKDVAAKPTSEVTAAVATSTNEAAVLAAAAVSSTDASSEEGGTGTKDGNGNSSSSGEEMVVEEMDTGIEFNF